MAQGQPLRFLLYSHDGLGLGNVRRNLAISSAIVRVAPGSSVLLVTDSGPAARPGLDRGVDILRLPAPHELGNGRYGVHRLAIPGDELRALRGDQITAAVTSFRPDVLLVDTHPAGVCNELLPALDILRRDGGRAVLGFRDILDEPARVRRDWRRAGTGRLMRSAYDEVLVYGMPQVHDFRNAYGLRSRSRCEVRYMGYVVHMAPSREVAVDSLPPVLLAPRKRPLVLATAGGGEDGAGMLAAFIETSRTARWEGLVVAGPNMPPARRHSLRRAAVAAGVGFRVFADDLAGWLREVDAVVCMGGYNTLVESVFRGTPTVCVPRVSPRSEQLIRARAFETLGLLQVVDPRQLDARRLDQSVEAALSSSRPELARRALRALDFHGAWRVAEELVRLASLRRSAIALPVAQEDAIPVGAV